MRVVYVSKALSAAAYRDKIRELDRTIRVTAVVPERWGSDRIEASPPGVPEPRRARVRLHGHNHLHFYPGAADWLDELAPDLVHIDEEPYSVVTLQIARSCRARRRPALFFAWQNLDRRLPPPFGWIRRAVFRTAAAGIAGSEAAAAALRRAGYEGRLAVIPQFGVDPDRFRPDERARADTRRRLGIPADAFVVGYGGRLVAEKGVGVLLDAFARLGAPARGDGPEAPAPPWLVLIGEGPESGRIGPRATTLGVRDRVVLTGRAASTDMPALLAALDALVLPTIGTATWTEQFGRILVEAMACGVPVVGSAVGEIPGVIGHAGDLVPPGDAAALAAALDRLHADPRLRRTRGEAGRQRVAERFTQAAVADRTVAFYRDVLNGGRTGP